MATDTVYLEIFELFQFLLIFAVVWQQWKLETLKFPDIIRYWKRQSTHPLCTRSASKQATIILVLRMYLLSRAESIKLLLITLDQVPHSLASSRSSVISNSRMCSDHHNNYTCSASVIVVSSSAKWITIWTTNTKYRCMLGE